MDSTRNRFLSPLLAQLRQLECELVGLYAEACYSGIQAAYGNRSCMERAVQLDEALQRTAGRLARLHERLRRLDVRIDDRDHLDASERRALFEATLCRHDTAFAAAGQGLSEQLLYDMLEDFAVIETGSRRDGYTYR